MRKVRILQSLIGNPGYTVGDIASFPLDEADRLIAAGIAEPADQVRTAAASMEGVETAVNKKVSKK